MRSHFNAAAVALALSVAGLVAAPVAAQSSAEAGREATTEKLAIAREIVDIGFPEAQREALFFGTMDTMMAQMREGMTRNLPSREPGVEAIFDEWLDEWAQSGKAVLAKHIPSIMDAQAVGYAQLFTVNELQDIHAFISTPSGLRFFQLSPEVMATPAFAEANQAYIQEVLAQLPAAKVRLTKRIEEYLKANQE